MKSIKVDFRTKNATIAFDERVISAQEVALALADTPHMMGRDMEYGGALWLKVAGVKDKATAKKAQDALSEVEGVSKVTVQTRTEGVSIEFGNKGKVTTKQLLDALDEAGLKGSLYGSTSAARSANGRDETAMGNHAGMRMNGDMAGMRMGGMRGHRMSCCCPMCMEMMGMDMDDMDDMDAPPPTNDRYGPPARGYYPIRTIRSGGCGYCR